MIWTILYKRCKHPWILVSVGVLEAIPHGYWETTVFYRVRATWDHRSPRTMIRHYHQLQATISFMLMEPRLLCFLGSYACFHFLCCPYTVLSLLTITMSLFCSHLLFLCFYSDARGNQVSELIKWSKWRAKWLLELKAWGATHCEIQIWALDCGLCGNFFDCW